MVMVYLKMCRLNLFELKISWKQDFNEFFGRFIDWNVRKKKNVQQVNRYQSIETWFQFQRSNRLSEFTFEFQSKCKKSKIVGNKKWKVKTKKYTKNERSCVNVKMNAKNEKTEWRKDENQSAFVFVWLSLEGKWS